MIDAWQLIDSVREISVDRLITTGVLDRGLWLDGNRIPMVSSTQSASDFTDRFIQFNLDGRVGRAGGMNPEPGAAWHGTWAASDMACPVRGP